MTEWKKVFLYAIVPAIIAGIFTVAPKLYDEYTAPKAVLEYKITRGPILREGGEQKSIYAFDVINNGRKPLSKVHAAIKTLGKIEAISTYESTGLSPVIDQSGTVVSVETLHPNEHFTVSIMLVAKPEHNKVEFVLRSKEALGSKFKSIDKKKGKELV